jgi:hypothetical protein
LGHRGSVDVMRDDESRSGATESALEREMGLIREAIAMVASGGAPSVTLGSLRLGEQLLEPARHIAARNGVRVVPLFSADEAGVDLRIERDDG